MAFEPQNNSTRRRPRVLLGVTGSVAAVKGPEIALRLSRDLKMDVRVLLTKGGQNFWQKSRDYNSQHWEEVQKRLVLANKSSDEATADDVHNGGEKGEGTVQIHDADEEWRDWNRLGDPILHIDLRDWADIFVIAPLSAHTLAKVAQGLCDDTLSCVARAWDFGYGIRPGKPLLLAPAMNTAMWEHPLTQQHLNAIQGFWNRKHDTEAGTNNTQEEEIKGAKVAKTSQSRVKIIAPQVKNLACGELGNGALAAVDEILESIQQTVLEYHDKF